MSRIYLPHLSYEHTENFKAAAAALCVHTLKGQALNPQHLIYGPILASRKNRILSIFWNDFFVWILIQ